MKQVMRRDPSLIPLSHQHHNGLALCVLTDRSLAEDASPANVARLARRAADRYEIELINHFEIEEQLLFAGVERALGPDPLIAELVAEHRQIEALVKRLAAAPDADTLGEFTALLRRHIRREENELFERVQKELSRELLDRLGEEIDRRAIRVCL
jgi:iron-sulfur cluster repair protein YtfE (RIC family)